ncbi:hypothetical protein JVT61DRAFT_9996 [Boletus reticuloceps]|uniref:DUF6729 domain-containing protein n=1 Tax=Boletus reticuloceps TaxID=495285 RepID=A0A8I3AEJ8_9AGAM|nr:hypothetical protein JVT61DRAFT_9996 [Boletus reticuloceps]
MSEPVKRGRGRPKGSKNRPGTTNVGRPRKDGQPTRVRNTPVAEQSRQEHGRDSSSLVPMHSGAPQGAAHRSSAIEDIVTPTDASKNSNSESRNLPRAPQPVSSQDIMEVHSRSPSPELRRSADLRGAPSGPLHARVAGSEQGRLIFASGQLSVVKPPVSQCSAPTTPDHVVSEVVTPKSSLSLLTIRADHEASTDLPPDEPTTRGPVVPAVAPASQMGGTSTMAWGDHRASSDPHSTAQRSLPRLQRPPMKVISPSNVIMNPYGSDLSAAATADQGSQGSEDEDDGDDDSEVMAEEFMRTCDDEEVDEEDRSCFTETACPNGERPSPANQSQGSGARSSLPLWLTSEYQNLREWLNAEMSRSSKGMPACYERQSFYDGVENPFLTARMTFQLTAGIFHQPQFFIWLPHLLVDRIPCPSCLDAHRQPSLGSVVYLQKHGFVSSPRRVIDIDRNIYIVGFRYLCGHKVCRRSYQSWSPSIINVLPPLVASQFEFRLTYCSGLTSRLSTLLRESFHAGLGPCRFTTMIESFHYRRFDLLQRQFLEMVVDRSTRGSLSSCWTTTSPFGEFNDRDGYAGFVPRAPYFGHFYDMLVEESAWESQQLIASLPADILKQDHSFKAIKRMGKTEGASTFNAIFTTVNQYGEIRSMTFTPSKAQDGWGPVLSAMLPSLASFGHGPPKVVFTDNIRADKEKLLSIFPSLAEGVTPVPQPCVQDELVLPEDWSVVELTTTHQVNHRFSIIMNHHTTSIPVTVGFSMQWPVDTASCNVGCVGLIQISYQKTVYLIKSNAYLKVGMNIVSNFRRLHDDCTPTCQALPFAGQVDLAQMARERGAAQPGVVGITTLCSNVLRNHLSQDPSICVSSTWGQAQLPASFINQATLDVYAVWAVYMALKTVDASQPVSSATPGGTPVTMFAPDGRALARGVIALDRPATFKGINVTKTRAIMVVREVVVPAYLISGTLLQSGHPTALSNFGPVPFSIICQAGHLHTSPMPLPITVPGITTVTQTSHSSTAMGGVVAPPLEEPLCELNADEAPLTADMLSTDEAETGLQLPEQRVADSSTDLVAHDTISQLLLDIMNFDSECLNLVHTHILGDVWHLFHQFPISLHHGLRRPFTRALSAAIFLTNTNDKRAVEEVLRAQNMTYSAKLKSRPEWVLTRVRRYVPPPEILYSRVASVVKTYGPLQDTTTGQPLFNDKAWDVTKNILEHVRKGYYSDPPDVPLYFEVGKDAHGLTLYRCCRGTNNVEGGVHQNLICCFTSFNVSTRRAVGTQNRTGQRYIGHFDIPLKNCIAELRERTSHALHQDVGAGYGKWVNGNDYEHTKEIFGILPFDEATRQQTGMLPYNSAFTRDQNVRHPYLSKQQGTRFAVLPIHTQHERDLFRAKVATSQLFAGPNLPDFIAVARDMNAHADGHHAFYKLPEHLRAYYKTWQENTNEKTSVTLSNDAIERIRGLLMSQVGTPSSVLTTTPKPLVETIRAPTARPQTEANASAVMDQWQLTKVLTKHQLACSALQYRYGNQPEPAPVSASTSTLVQDAVVRKRRADADADAAGTAAKRSCRKARSCKSCQSIVCPGRWNVSKCAAKVSH